MCPIQSNPIAYNVALESLDFLARLDAFLRDVLAELRAVLLEVHDAFVGEEQLVARLVQLDAARGLQGHARVEFGERELVLLAQMVAFFAVRTQFQHS